MFYRLFCSLFYSDYFKTYCNNEGEQKAQPYRSICSVNSYIHMYRSLICFNHFHINGSQNDMIQIHNE